MDGMLEGIRGVIAIMDDIGIDKNKQRGHDVFYWPGMNAEIPVVVRNCSQCTEFQNKLPLKPTENPRASI